ncbi:GATOR complex protein MIOS-A, partial [Araneus ventricosus]
INHSMRLLFIINKV